MNIANILHLLIATTAKARLTRIEYVLDLLQLTSLKDVNVGGVGAKIRGLSPGERKRLGIAIEILNLPDVIFLDGKIIK